jgi:hypothetical protein
MRFRPPPDPYLPIINRNASKSTGTIELPQAWRAVRQAQTDYCAAYAELMSLSKRLNRLIAKENLSLSHRLHQRRLMFSGWSNGPKVQD